MKPSIQKSLLATAVVCALSTESAFAQLEEVIVTAERREANLQETPISIQVLSSEEIQSRGIKSAMDLVDSHTTQTLYLHTKGPHNPHIYTTLIYA